MLTYTFDINSSVPLYIQLYQFVKEEITTGILSPDEHLPSKRNLASNMGISTITVENAYSQLMAEGYIYSIAKRGYFVSDLSVSGSYLSTGHPPKQASMTAPPLPFLSNNANLQITTISEENAKPVYLADFASNHTNPDNFPFSIWSKLLREELSENKTALMTQAPACGVYKLRASISNHLRAFRGMNVSPEQIVVGAGTEYLYGLLIQLLGRDKTYCVENPGYRKISRIYKSNGVHFCRADMDKYGLSVPVLRKSGANIVHISPTHHFPTGITMPISRRYELLAWAAEQSGRYIIEDDYDSEFRLTGNPIPSLQSIDACEKVIYINTFSKSLASTIRISYMVLPQSLMKKFNNSLSFYSCTVPNFEQYTLSAFIDNGYFEKHINRMRLYYGRQRTAILNAIKNSPLSNYVSIVEADSGLHFLVKVKTDISDNELTAQLLKKGIRITALSEYYENAPIASEHTFIINYSSLDVTKLPEIIKVMEECISHFSNS